MSLKRLLTKLEHTFSIKSDRCSIFRGNIRITCVTNLFSISRCKCVTTREKSHITKKPFPFFDELFYVNVDILLIRTSKVWGIARICKCRIFFRQNWKRLVARNRTIATPAFHHPLSPYPSASKPFQPLLNLTMWDLNNDLTSCKTSTMTCSNVNDIYSDSVLSRKFIFHENLYCSLVRSLSLRNCAVFQDYR